MAASESDTASSVSSNPAGPSAQPGSIFGYRGFNQLFLGSLAGKFADRLYQMAMGASALIVFAGASPESQLALIQIVATIPLFFAYSLLGTLIDTYDRRRLMYLIMALKGVLVLGFVPLLWGVAAQTPEGLQFVRTWWPVGLALIFFISLIDGPFGPARAAAVPDVVPVEHHQLGASLMATSGLISLLLGTFAGLMAARPTILGPAYTILIALGFYVVSTLLLMFLPDAVAVPGNKRAKKEAEAAPPDEKLSWGEYFKNLFNGFRYCATTRGIFDLVFFETAFWCAASAFYLLFTWSLDHLLYLNPDDATKALAFALGSAGVGLTIGAISAGKMARKASPIFTYPISFLIMGTGFILCFNAPLKLEHRSVPEALAEARKNPKVETVDADKKLHQGAWVVRSIDPRSCGLARICRQAGNVDLIHTDELLKQNQFPAGHIAVQFKGASEPALVPASELTWLHGTLPDSLVAYLAFAGLIVGLGGGLMLGRVDADVLSISAPEMRGRVFSVKALCFTIALLGVMTPLSIAGVDVKYGLANWMGAGLIALSIPAFIFAWRVDIAIWAKRGDSELPGGFHHMGYIVAREIFRLFAKIMFRYEVVGGEKIPRTGPVLLAANHGAFIDPLLLGSTTPRHVQYIMHRAYYESIAHPIFRFLRCIPVESASPLGALKAGLASLEKGACIGIFPEGQVSVDGKLQPPQRGALFLAQRSGATVVPVAIVGNYTAWPRQSKLPRFSKIKMVVGEPFTVPKDCSKKQMAEIADKLMRDLAALLKMDPPPPTVDKDRGE
ncbi:MAG TPA: MFS transporter [Planctomycetota bacterium]|nr:MFS transporter [Planctomycetota bacterium]